MQQATDYGKSISGEQSSIEAVGREVSKSQTDFEASASDAAFSGIASRYNTRTQGVLDKTPEVDESKLAGVRTKGVYYEADKIAKGRKYLKFAEQKVEKFQGQADYGARKGLLRVANDAMDEAESQYQNGNPVEGSKYYAVGMAIADVVISLTPIVGAGKDAIELVTGVGMLDGHKLTTFERSMAGVGLATLGLAELGVFGKLANLGRVLGKSATSAEEAAKVAKSMERAEEIVAAAERGGIKDKGLIEEAADAVKQGMPCSIVENAKPINFFWLFEDVAYASDCLPGSSEDALKKLLESGGETAARPRVPGGEERLAKFTEPNE